MIGKNDAREKEEMYKKISMFLMVAFMVVALGGFAQAGRVPGPGDQFVIKAGTDFPTISPGPGGRPIQFMAKAFEDVTVTVTKLENGYVIFGPYKNFPHDCPIHGREPGYVIKGGVPFSYFEDNPDAFLHGS